MGTLARDVLTGHRRREDRGRASVRCPYCRCEWGPWTGSTIEACRACTRPLYLSADLNPTAHRNRVSSVLDTITALQGMFLIACIGGLALGWMSPRQLGQVIAMAMFVAASGYATDGVLGVRSGIVRAFGQLVTGKGAKAASIAKIGVGIVAFALSFLGIVLFGGRS